MCCVFKEPEGLLNVLTKSIHCVGNMLSVNLATWFINHRALQRYNDIFVFASEVCFF